MQPSRLPPRPWAGHTERHASTLWPQDPEETQVELYEGLLLWGQIVSSSVAQHISVEAELA